MRGKVIYYSKLPLYFVINVFLCVSLFVLERHAKPRSVGKYTPVAGARARARDLCTRTAVVSRCHSHCDVTALFPVSHTRPATRRVLATLCVLIAVKTSLQLLCVIIKRAQKKNVFSFCLCSDV